MVVTTSDSITFPSIKSFLSTTCLRPDFTATTVEDLVANEVRPAFDTWFAARQAWREAQMALQGEKYSEEARRDEEKAWIEEKTASIACSDQIVRHMGNLAVSNDSSILESAEWSEIQTDLHDAQTVLKRYKRAPKLELTELLAIYNATQSLQDKLGSIYPGSSVESRNTVPTTSSIADNRESGPEIAGVLSVFSDILIDPGRPEDLPILVQNWLDRTLKLAAELAVHLVQNIDAFQQLASSQRVVLMDAAYSLVTYYKLTLEAHLEADLSTNRSAQEEKIKTAECIMEMVNTVKAGKRYRCICGDTSHGDIARIKSGSDILEAVVEQVYDSIVTYKAEVSGIYAQFVKVV